MSFVSSLFVTSQTSNTQVRLRCSNEPWCLCSAQAPAAAQTDSDARGRRVNSDTKQMATVVRSTLPPSSTSGDVIASNWTRSEMLQRRRDVSSYSVILCWQVPASPFWRTDARAKGGGVAFA